MAGIFYRNDSDTGNHCHQDSAVQTKITHKAIDFLEHKIGTKVSLEAVVINFPKKIVIKEFYAEDQSKDTLLYTHELSVDTDLWGLLHNEISINSLAIEN